MEQFAVTLSYISLLSIILPILTFVIFPNYFKAGTYISILLIISLVADIANECYNRSGQSGFLIINSFFILQFLWLNLFYHQLLPKKLLIKTIVVLYAILVTANALYFQNFNKFQHLMRIYECICMVIYASWYYYLLFKKPSTDRRQNLLMLWFNMAVLFYFFFNLYLFGISNYVLTQMFRDDAMIIWGSHSFNNVVKNVLIAIGLYEAGKKQRT